MSELKDPDKILCAHLEGKSSKIVIDKEELCNFIKDKTKPPLFIIGFTGIGMIGSIIANELIEQLKMEQIGYVLSEDLPPITLFKEGFLIHPFRLYYHKHYNLIVSICEIPFNQGSYTDLARTLMNWALHEGIEDVICFQGISDKSIVIREGKAPVYAAAEKEIMEKIIDNDPNVRKPPRGLIMGAEAAILNECLNNKLNGAVYLTPANPQIPAPEGAAAILEKISRVYNIPIKLEGLLKQRDEIKAKLMDLQKQTNKIHSFPPKKISSIYT